MSAAETFHQERVVSTCASEMSTLGRSKLSLAEQVWFTARSTKSALCQIAVEAPGQFVSF